MSWFSIGWLKINPLVDLCRSEEISAYSPVTENHWAET